MCIEWMHGSAFVKLFLTLMRRIEAKFMRCFYAGLFLIRWLGTQNAGVPVGN